MQTTVYRDSRPDLEQGNVVIDLGILEQSIAGCETAALLKNL
ncbi:MAG: hypothetical protein WA231_08145 [Methylocella sp.]